MPPARPTCLGAAFAVLLTIPSAAFADEDESALSLSLTYAGYAVPDHNPKGAGLGVDYEYGVSDLVWLRASGGGAALYDAGSPAYAAHAEVGITYLLDVLNTVPHIDLGVGGIYLRGEDIESFEPLVQVGGGVDMLVSRQRSYGLFLRFESFLGRSAFFSAGARMTWRWGFF